MKESKPYYNKIDSKYYYNSIKIIINIIYMTERTQSQKKLDELLNLYLENVKGRNSSDGSLELEVRFGTKGFRKLTYIDYTNVVKILKSHQFRHLQQEEFLRITNEYVDPKTGVTKMSNIRTEVSGVGNISKYCKSDSISC